MRDAPHLHAPLPRGVGREAADTLARRFAVLADPSRLRIVYALLEGGAMCVSDVAAAASLGESATSHQLAKLRSSGAVASERRGREIWYRIADAHVRLLLDVAAEHYLGEA
jgi:DNA-binding transcriptional ArsR family regulator